MFEHEHRAIIGRRAARRAAHELIADRHCTRRDTARSIVWFTLKATCSTAPSRRPSPLNEVAAFHARAILPRYAADGYYEAARSRQQLSRLR